MSRSQFNTRIEKKILKLVTSDKTSSRVSNDVIDEVALLHWFGNKSLAERIAAYKQHLPRRYMGAK